MRLRFFSCGAPRVLNFFLVRIKFVACAPLITTHLVVTPRGGVGGLGKWVNSLLFSIGVALGGVEHNIQTPCEGGGSEIFLKGVRSENTERH